MRVVACPDKFRGTVGAVDATAAIAAAVESRGGECVRVPMADGGEGTLDALGGPNRSSVVTGPLGEPVEAAWRLSRGVAVIEMARASGLTLAGHAEGNHPLEATTFGTGELISEAVAAGAKQVIVGVGGSATTDGGFGAIRAMSPLSRFRGVDLEIACDVETLFVDAAEVYGPQKGASSAQVEMLRRRLVRLVDVYFGEHGVSVGDVVGSGAAGGLAGGLLVAGAELSPGFELIADVVGLHEAIEGADLVITGEGRLDASSFRGKVVGGVDSLAAESGVPVVAVVGSCALSVAGLIEVVDLTERFGADEATGSTLECIEIAVGEIIDRWRQPDTGFSGWL